MEGREAHLWVTDLAATFEEQTRSKLPLIVRPIHLKHKDHGRGEQGSRTLSRPSHELAGNIMEGPIDNALPAKAPCLYAMLWSHKHAGAEHDSLRLIFRHNHSMLQGWAAKVVQGDLGERPNVALVARAMYIAEVAGTRPRWPSWQPGDTQFVRWGWDADALASGRDVLH